LAEIRLDIEGARARLTIVNRGRGNAMSPAMMKSLADVLGSLHERGVRVASITGGGGKAFCSGYDLSELPRGAAAETEPSSWEHRFPELTAMLKAFDVCAIPLIAELNGHAIGGGALVAAACDFRIAQHGARFHVPATRLGVLYPLEGLRRLVALVGLSRATEIFLLGDPIEAERALGWGLHREVVDPEELAGRVDELAERLAVRAPLSMRGLRALLRAEALGADEEQLRGLHHRWTTRCLASADLTEGLAASRERRAPTFSGR
jgi:enoyl-CoA hydratase